MKKTTLAKIEKIHDQTSEKILSAAGFNIMGKGVSERDLQTVFGKAATKKMLHDINHIQDQSVLSWFAEARERNNFPCLDEIWIFANRDPADLQGKNLRSVFSSLTTKEIHEVRKNLEDSGFRFKGNRILAFDWTGFKQPR